MKFPDESAEQKAVVRYLDKFRPNVLFCASAGGMRTSKSQAVKMKLTGYKAGFPDMFIYEPRGQYKGLAIEMKVGGIRDASGKIVRRAGTTSKKQKEWIAALQERGYAAIACKGANQAIKMIEQYLNFN